MDFLGDIVHSSSAEPIRRALNGVLDARSYLDDEQASRALAAAEIVAAMLGNPSRSLPPPCKEWAMVHSKNAEGEFVQLAIKAVNRIANESETRDLMLGGGESRFQEWQASMRNLGARLAP